MTITNPSLELTFLGNDITSGHSTTQTVSASDIIFHSITFKYQLLNGLKPSSNQVNLQINRKCTSIEDIIATESDIKAVLKDGRTVLFTGYLSTNFSYSITDSGEKAMNITIEDIGTRLFGKNFIDTGYHLFYCSVHDALLAVCEKASVTVSQYCYQITDNITKVVEAGISCSDIITQMLYEVGYVYYFDSFGELMLFKIDCTSTDSIPVLDKDKLYIVSDKAVVLSKKIRQYKSAKVTFKTLGSADNFLIYRNTTGQDDSHQYCNMELFAGHWFDGTEIYTPSEWQEQQLDEFRVPAIIEACNADSENEKVGSRKIVSITNVVQNFVAPSDVTCSIVEAGGPYIKITAHNTASASRNITRMDAYASIVYEKDTCIVRTSQTPVTDDISDNLLEEECSYIHTQSLAQKHANLVGQFSRYCNCQYTFYSSEDLALGSLVKLHDNIFTGLQVNVMLVGKTVSDATETIKYTAIGISVFNLTEDVWHQVFVAGKTRLSGAKGDKGDDGESFTVDITSSNGSVFRQDNINTTLTCHVFQNSTEITDLIDSSQFNWKRKTNNPTEDERWNSSAKAIAHKSVDITEQDCLGRTVFFCEVELSDRT